MQEIQPKIRVSFAAVRPHSTAILSACLLATSPLPASDPVPTAASPTTPSLDRESIRRLTAEGAAAFAAADWPRARRTFQSLLRLDPNNSRVLSNLGAVSFQEHDYKEAILRLEEALRGDPTLVRTWETLGMAYHRDGQSMLAVSCLTRAAALEPREPRIHNELAVVLLGLGWTRGAERSLHTAVELDPEYAEAHYNLALMYLARDSPSPELARRHYLQAVALGVPKDSEFERDLEEANAKVYQQPD